MTDINDARALAERMEKVGATNASTTILALVEKVERIKRINEDHCRSVNTLLVDGARLQDRATAAEAKLAEMEGQLQTVLQRETDSIARHDKRLDELEAKLAEAEKERDEAKDEAVNFVFDRLAKALGLSAWTQQDGSETWAGDVAGTLYGILREAHVLHPETDTLATVRATAAEAKLDEKDAHIAAQAQDIMTLSAALATATEALLDTTASLVAATSLLQRGRKTARLAAASDKMFDQMIADYEASIGRARAALSTLGATNGQ